MTEKNWICLHVNFRVSHERQDLEIQCVQENVLTNAKFLHAG